MRRDYLGFVYQYHNLLGDFDAVENVVLPQLIAGVKKKEAEDRAKWLLNRLGWPSALITVRASFQEANNNG